MRKLGLILLVMWTLLISCKATSHKCDAYSSTEEQFSNDTASDKKYVGFEVIK